MAGQSHRKQKERLFEEKLVPAKPGSSRLFDVSYGDDDSQSVKCLGMTFTDDDARREYFLAKLRERLKDPDFRKIEGFPIGQDEYILAMSDPPFHSACPNPFIADFIAQYHTSFTPTTDAYHREPFAADVSEGKTDPIYKAHTYHTKVPPRAAAAYILHYTEPGDTVLDVFAGSGMTGVACSLCSSASLAGEYGGTPGSRHGILVDLSPAATLIASVYLSPPDASQFDAASQSLLDQAEESIGGVWSFQHAGKDGRVEFQTWAEVFGCPVCQAEVLTGKVVEATESIGTAKELPCPHCGALVSKAPSKGTQSHRLERRLKHRHDQALNVIVPYLPRAPLTTHFVVNGSRSDVPTPASETKKLAAMTLSSPYWYPTNALVHGERYKVKDCVEAYGITHVHHLYLPRQLLTYSCLWHYAASVSSHSLRNALLFFLQSNALGMTVLNRYGPTHFSQVNRYFSGTLYIPSVVAETSHRYTYENKRDRLVKVFRTLDELPKSQHMISTQSATDLRQIPDNSIDYVFTDPPFGQNLQYSELNQIWEAWLRVFTNRDPEAVIDGTRQRDVLGYGHLMREAFIEVHRVLKPGRWVTVVFHNSHNAVWFTIQEALLASGLMVADVRTLDKQYDTYKQSRQGLVKHDLVISAYKPTRTLETKFRIEAGTEHGAWEFVATHLRQLPLFVAKGDRVEVVAERQSYLLFDRMVAFHVQRGVGVPMSAAEFYDGLQQRFPERDGMYFLADEVATYDKKRLAARDVEQLEFFVSDEASAIQWLRHALRTKPQPLSELQPLFMRELAGWQKHEKQMELLELLEYNFLCYTGDGDIPSHIHAYLSTNFKELRGLKKDDARLIAKAKGRWYVPDPKKEADLEKLRHKILVKEFRQYPDSKGKLKIVRTEALRAGFKECWQNGEYATIVGMAKKVQEEIIQEDPALLMYYDNALMRAGE